MKFSGTTMGMPVIVLIVDKHANRNDINEILDYFSKVDNKFSTYKKTSEIEKINQGKLHKNEFSNEMKHVLQLCEDTRQDTKGYFNIKRDGKLDPSGLVKGYAIYQAAQQLLQKGYKNFFVEIAGDAQMYGENEQKQKWKIGIENPFNRKEIIKVVHLTNKGIATSGTASKGMHIYNPITNKEADEVVSITVIGPNVYDADRFATAAFAMGKTGITFIEQLEGFEAYMVDKNKVATMTSGFEKYTL